MLSFGYLEGLSFGCAYRAMFSQWRAAACCYFLSASAVFALMPLEVVVERSIINSVSRPLSFFYSYNERICLCIHEETTHSCLRLSIHEELCSTFTLPLIPAIFVAMYLCITIDSRPI